jgi:hypothetical protein
MRLNITLAHLLAGMGVAAAIVAAPLAAAAAHDEVCLDLGSSTQCQTPGNVQIQNIPAAQQPGGSYGPFFTYDRGGR